MLTGQKDMRDIDIHETENGKIPVSLSRRNIPCLTRRFFHGSARSHLPSGRTDSQHGGETPS